MHVRKDQRIWILRAYLLRIWIFFYRIVYKVQISFFLLSGQTNWQEKEDQRQILQLESLLERIFRVSH